MSPGDEAVALNDLKLTSSNIDDLLKNHHAGDQLTLTIFRQDELLRLRISLMEAPEDTCYLLPDPDASPSAEMKREAWLDIG